MFNYTQSIIKEIKILYRDIGGLIMLFVMPILLVTIVTVIQDSTFVEMTGSSIPVLMLDQDQGSISNRIKSEIAQSSQFKPIDKINNKILDENIIKRQVGIGNYQIGIIIPPSLSKDLNQVVRRNVNLVLEELGMDTPMDEEIMPGKKEVKIYFDPALPTAYKTTIKENINKLVAKMESEMVYSEFQKQLGSQNSALFQDSLIRVREIIANSGEQIKQPNSVEHNVPAWTLFAVFFIMVPLSINIVKEKNQGTYLRLLCSPSSNLVLYSSKMIVYLMICLLQFASILLVAYYIFPFLNLPDLHLSVKQIGLMALMTIASGSAAITMSILLGIACSTQEQSAPFGAIFVIILGAIGGLWIPVFAMSETLQTVSKLSPMNWALGGYYDIVLRNVDLVEILPNILTLLLFGLFIGVIAMIYDKKKKRI